MMYETRTPNSASSTGRTPGRRSAAWWIGLLGMVVWALLIVLLPLPYSRVLLLGLLCLGTAVVARRLVPPCRRLLHVLSGFLCQAIHHARQLALAIRAFAAAHREQLSAGLSLAACGLFVVSAIGFRPASSDEAVGQAALIALLGALALGAARMLSSEGIAPPPSVKDAPPSARANIPVVLAGVAALAVVAEMSGRALRIPALDGVSHHVQFAFLCAGVGLVVWGLCGAPRPVRPRIDWRAAAPVLAILFLALAVRVWDLNTSIRGSVDEGTALEGMAHAWGTQVGLVARPSGYISTVLFPYWQTVVVDALGHSLATFRLTSAVAGALTTVALYLLVAALFDDRKMALMAAFLLAVFPPHVHFSRIALLHIADALFGTLALAFAARGFVRRRRVDWALAGVCLGLTQYFFEAGRLFYPPLVIGWIGLMVIGRHGRQIDWRGMGSLALAAALTAAPVYYAALALHMPLAARTNISGLDWGWMFANGVTPQAMNEVTWRLGLPFQVFVHRPELADTYGGSQALVLEYLVPLFLAGVFYLIQPRRPAMLLIPLWILATALANFMLRENAVYARYVVVFPAVAAAMAVAVCYVLPMCWPGGRQTLLPVAQVALLGIVGIAQVDYYFGQHVAQLNAQLRRAKPYRDGIDAVLRAADQLPGNTLILMISDPVNDANVLRSFLGFLLEDHTAMDLFTLQPQEVDRDYLLSLPRNKNYAFFLEPGDTETLALIGRFFRVGPPQESPYTDVPTEEEYLLYYAPLEADLRDSGISH